MRYVSWAAGALLAYVVVLLLSNTAALGRPFLPGPALLPARALKLNQTWPMFAPDPHRTMSTLTGEATLVGGERVPLDLRASARWRLYLAKVYTTPARETRASLYWSYLARYLCRTMPASRADARAIVSVAFVRLDTPVFDAHAGPPERVPVFSTRCTTSS